MDSYIVRVYRRDEDDPAKIAGMVEAVGTGQTRRFKDRDELCGVICGKRAKKSRRAIRRLAEEVREGNSGNRKDSKPEGGGLNEKS